MPDRSAKASRGARRWPGLTTLIFSSLGLGVLSGLLLGTFFGLLLAWFTLSSLNFNWGGLAAAPPFVVVWDWLALARTYLFFGITMLAALGLAVWISRRAGIQQALRLAVD